ncbi:MAG: hypothetical protein V4473_02220 [Patescibacteria group bacterium]
MDKKQEIKNELPKGVHVLYKKLGETPLECIERFRNKNPELQGVSITYAGRLDPMAEGLLIVLSGDAVHEKEKYLGMSKTYFCEVLWGVETDTLDVLGLLARENSLSSLFLKHGVARGHSPASLSDRRPAYGFKNNESENFPSISNLQNILKACGGGKMQQQYPAYSSKPVNGTPLFQWAREGIINEIEIPSHEVELFDTKFVSRGEVLGSELLEKIKEKIGLVKGDFRQEEIVAGWEKFFDLQSENSFVIDTIQLTVSSGFYVRQFVADLAREFGTIATTFHIKRTQIGDFHSDL